MLCFGGNTSVLESDFYPPLDTREGEWEIGLISFTSCNSIPNVELSYNNKLHYYAPLGSNVLKDGSEEEDPAMTHHELTSMAEKSIKLNPWYELFSNSNPKQGKTPKQPVRSTTSKNTHSEVLEYVSLPEGSFEFQTIADLLTARLHKRNIKLQMAVDPSTMKCLVLSDAILDFRPSGSIGQLLGFNSNRVIEANKEARGDTTVQINRPNVLRVKCNIVSGSYSNGVKDHVIYEFYPNVDPGYKMIVTVQNVIYLPVDAEQIGHITLEVVDESGRLVNNRSEEINITLHLRQRK